jgi:hypothetical protein
VVSVAGAAAIIDQDAEKFRLYLSKIANPGRKNISAPIQVGVEQDPPKDHATALGQAVAFENIQQQLEIQNQLLGQLQGTMLLTIARHCIMLWFVSYQELTLLFTT